MTVAELALLITTLTSAIVAIVGVRNNTAKIAELERQTEHERQQRIDLQDKQEDARKDIIQIGEQLHHARLDNAVIAEGFNMLYSEFRDVTGHKPAVNLERLRHMQTIQYITGPLEGGPLQVKD